MDGPKEGDFLIIPMMKRRMLKVSLLPFLILFFLFGSAYSSPLPTSEALPKGSWWIDMGEFLSAPHGRFSCSECHANLEEKGVKHPDPKLLGKVPALLYDYKKCEKCHPQEYQRYIKGAHAKALLEKKKDAPTCGSCHVTHYALHDRSRLELGKWMTEMCGICHLIQKRTYLENYHGKTAALLNYEASAYCTDCHGAHICLSLKKKEDALKACQKCHANAKLRFAGFVIHASEKGVKKEEAEKLEKVRIIKWVEIGFGIFVFGVLVFFYFHTLVWALRKVHEWLRRE